MMMTVRLSSYAITNVYAKTMHNKYKRRKTMRVEVYFNLHKHLFSVRLVRSGRVILHTDKIHIQNPEFVVRQGGRQRVLREGKKNVHAFVRGHATHFSDIEAVVDYDGSDYTVEYVKKKRPTLDNVGYNPYKYDSFIKLIDKTPVRKAKRAYLMMKPTLIEPVYRPYIYAEGAEPC